MKRIVVGFKMIVKKYTTRGHLPVVPIQIEIRGKACDAGIVPSPTCKRATQVGPPTADH